MRTIKFRALDNLGAWIYGIPQTSSTLHLTLDCMAQYFTEQRKYGRQNVTVKPETIGQFTGLLDKNGNEIYEGDILKDRIIVTWREDLASFALMKEGWAYDHYFGEAIDAGNTEIIGSIHTTTELLNH